LTTWRWTRTTRAPATPVPFFRRWEPSDDHFAVGMAAANLRGGSLPFFFYHSI
jgi:hypothetical protein